MPVHRNWSGLNTDVNPHSAVPEGAMRIARNLVHRRQGLLEPRKALLLDRTITSMPGSDGSLVNQARAFGGDVLGLNADGVRWLSDDTSDVEDASEDDVELTQDARFCNAVEMRDTFYVASSSRGIQKFSAPAQLIAQDAGLVPPSLLEHNGVFTTGPTDLEWFPNNDFVGYRAVFRRVHSNGLVTQSAPSMKLISFNNVGDGYTEVRVRWLPFSGIEYKTVQDGDFIDLYRTIVVSDEALVPEIYRLAVTVQIEDSTNSLFDIVDTTPQNALGLALYTNSGKAPNLQPSYGKVLNAYQGSLFIGNLISTHYMSFVVHASLTAVGDTPVRPGAQSYASTSFTNGSPVFTAPSGHDIRVGQIIDSATAFPFFVSLFVRVISVVGDTITVSEDSEATVSEVFTAHDTIAISDRGNTLTFSVINASVFLSASLIRFYILTSSQDLFPTNHVSSVVATSARFILRQPRLNGFVPSFTVTHGELYDPILPETDGGTPQDWEQDVETNKVRWSKFQQPEHFSPIDVETINDTGDLEALVTADNRQYAFFSDGSIVLCQGESQRSGFRFDRLSGKLRLMSPKHAIGYGEKTEFLAALTDQGLVLLSPGGGFENVTDHRVSELLKPYRPVLGSAEGNLGFDPVNRELIVTLSSSAAGALCLRFNTLTATWTTIDYLDPPVVPLLSFVPRPTVSPEGLGLYVASSMVYAPAEGSLSNDLEYYSDAVPRTLSTAVPTDQGDGFWRIVGTQGSQVFFLLPGDAVYDTAEDEYGVIISVAVDTTTDFDVVVFSDTGFSASPDTIYRAINVQGELVPQSGEDVAAWKRLDEVEYTFEGQGNLYQPTLYLRSSNSGTAQEVDDPIALFDHDAADGLDARPRIMASSEHSHARMHTPGFVVRQAGAKWALSAITLHSRTESRRDRP